MVWIYKKRRLADLLLALVKVEGIEWIRLHYAFPSAFPMEVIALREMNQRFVITLTFLFNIFQILF